MVTVSPKLLNIWINKSEIIARAVNILEKDEEVIELLKMSNINAVMRMGYNDHGPVHSRIVAGAALEILDILHSRGVIFTSMKHGVASGIDEVQAIVVLAAYLHDLGNAIHREMHEYMGALLAKDIIDRVLPAVLGDLGPRRYLLRQEVMHAIYATEYDTRCLTVEAGTVKVADGLDMSEGRARIPYKLGKVDIHAVSALSIKKVEIVRGRDRPVKIIVHMDDMAGLFQIERVLTPKIRTSGIEKYIEVEAFSGENRLISFP